MDQGLVIKDQGLGIRDLEIKRLGDWEFGE